MAKAGLAAAFSTFSFRDVLVAAGFVAMTWGVWEIDYRAGAIFGGLLLLVVGVLSSLPARSGRRFL